MKEHIYAQGPPGGEAEVQVTTFFWEGAHTMTTTRFHRVRQIHAVMTSEFCCDRGLVLEMVLSELADEELRVLEKVIQRCQAARQVEAAEEQTAEDRMLEIFSDIAS